jgi:acyl-coenzyme A synthetase/AMP-(fatty) acid ligase/acyl carrier protein
MVKLTPSHLRGMIEHLRYAPPVEGTIVFVSGGEELPAKVAADTRRAFPGGRIVNEYGPTENTVGCTIHWVGEADERSGGVPAGRPVPATTVYVAGRGMQPAPVGVIGELMLGGVQLALGYLGRPALTAERWVPDPFSGRPGARLYHSGDRVRWRADGVLEFLGRGDDQVKIRGFRIEPGEVEAALLALPAVSQAAVIVREDVPGERRLVAYVVPIGPFNPAELRAALGKTLPEHMVPAAFVPLEALPLTPNAKLDRKALPAPESLAGPAREVVPPRTTAEHTIAAIWREALGVEEVGVEDNFFELGGHSLLLTRVHAGIREAFAREVRLVDLFRHTTIASQAAFVTEDMDAPAAPARAPARADARRGAVSQGALRGGRR